MEEWRDVKGYEGIYMVSNLGNLKRKHKEEWVKKSFVIDKATGYNRVTLYKNGVSKIKYIHRLVAESFIDNPDNKSEVDHINTIRTDNRVENLRWATRKENRNNPLTIEKLRIAFTGENSPHFGKKRSKETCSNISNALKNSSLNKNKTGILCKHSRPIYQYDKKGHFINGYVGQSEAARILNIKQGDISRVANFKRNFAGGYIWRKYKVDKLNDI